MRTYCDSVNFVVSLMPEEVAKIRQLDKDIGPTLLDVLDSDPDIECSAYQPHGVKTGVHYTLAGHANTLVKRKQIQKWVMGYLS